MPKQSLYEKDANKDDCTMLTCTKCGGTNWYVFVFKDSLEFHCRGCDDNVVRLDNLPQFCKQEFKEEL